MKTLDALAAPPRPARPLPGGLPALLGPLHRRVAEVVERLPTPPPSWLLARALNRWLLPRWPDDAHEALRGRVVELRVSDFGLRVRLVLGADGFQAAAGGGEPALRISSTADGYLRLAQGRDDPDRLFFDRVLVMEGDTEVGLVLKNTLDAIGPLWPPRPR